MTKNIRDTAFTFMFNDELYMAQLYNYLTGKEIKPEDIKSVRIDSGLTKPRLYNDVACITKDNHLLVMIEHQSRLNNNMLFRMMEYYAALVSRFVIKENDQNKYGTKEIQIPKADFYIVYNGKGKMKDFPKLNLGDIEVKGKVSNIHFDNLTHHQTNHALVAYAKLIELTENYKMHINDAIDELLAQGYLVDFFGRKEIRDMFAEIFSYDQELIEQGIEQGEQKKAIETAKAGLKNNIPLETISLLTGLTLAELEDLSGDDSHN